MRRKICTLIHSAAAHYSGPIFCVYGIILIVISKLISCNFEVCVRVCVCLFEQVLFENG